MNFSSYVKLAVSIIICELAGVIGSIFTSNAIPTWYSTLLKPELNPPSWVFGPVWITLYALMGISAFLVWQKRESILAKVGLKIFAVQLLLNTFWSIIFFGLRNPAGAFLEIIFLWISIVLTIIIFAKISKPAAWLLIPYLVWVSFAGYLNYSIWQLNSPSNSGQIACTMEAKLCPDGSYVGRTGPRCEFASCPKESLADQLAKCLPMSDMASKEKCDGLLKQINNFEGCASAGFPIMESYPRQCAIPDGRTFTEEI